MKNYLDDLVNRVMKRIERGSIIVPNERGLRRLLKYVAVQAVKLYKKEADDE